jgi:hypothetical protein
LIGPEERTKISHVRSYAEENPYYPGADEVPGSDDNYVCMLGTYRCVFTITRHKGLVARHLSISVPGEGYPHPESAFTIADEFGFTGWDQKTVDRLPKTWFGSLSKKDHCIVLIQEIDEDAI